MPDRAAEVRDLDARARHHKQQASHHRRVARSLRKRQAGLEKECRRLGIDVTHTKANGEGDIHGRRNTDTRS